MANHFVNLYLAINFKEYRQWQLQNLLILKSGLTIIVTC
jgi:hypothetical protein